jgi:hypothetical protein
MASYRRRNRSSPRCLSVLRDDSARSSYSASSNNRTASAGSGPLNPSIWVLILVPVVSVLGTLGVPVLEATLSEDPPKLTRPCVEIAAEYIDGLRTSPGMRELIIPGDDGESIATADPEAQLCGIRPETLDRIAKGPVSPPR